jgi:putative hemolysin
MNNKTTGANAALSKRGLDLFLGAERADKHIVDTLIEERAPTMAAHPSWPLVRPVLHTLLGYPRAVHMADTLSPLSGREAFEYLQQELALKLDISGLDRLPQHGRAIVAANHPTGLADGVAVYDLLMRRRQDLIFFANADALRVNRQFEDIIIPVEWVMDKRTMGKTRETLRRAGEAFEAERCVVLFPSGRLARWHEGSLREQDWFSTVVSLARKQKAPIAPLHVSARNSKLYYLFCNLSKELRDITLFHELLNKKGSRFNLMFGPLIQPEQLEGDPQAVTDRLKEYVAYTLKDDPDRPFGA